MTAAVLRLLHRCDVALGSLLRGVPIVCLVALAALLLLNIVGRQTGLYSLAWFDEVVVTVFAWMVFIGAAALWRERLHFAISLLPDYLGRARTGQVLEVFIAAVGLAFACVLTYYSVAFVGRATATTPVLALPQAWAYACMPVSGAVMTVYGLRDLWRAAVTRKTCSTLRRQPN